MRVPGLILSDDRLMAEIRRDASLEQVANGARLPGIVGASLAMPDIHQQGFGQEGFGISKKVARLRPIGVVKG